MSIPTVILGITVFLVVALAFGCHRGHGVSRGHRIVISAPVFPGPGPQACWPEIAKFLAANRLFHRRRSVTFQVILDASGVVATQFYVPGHLTPRPIAEAIERGIPGATTTIEDGTPPLDPAHPVVAYRLRFGNQECFPLAVPSKGDLLVEMLGVIWPHHRNDRVLYQVTVRRAPPWRVRHSGSVAKALSAGRSPTAVARLIDDIVKVVPDRSGRRHFAEAAHRKSKTRPHWLVTVQLAQTTSSHARFAKGHIRRHLRGVSKVVCDLLSSNTQRVVRRRLHHRILYRLVAKSGRHAQLVGTAELNALAHLPNLPPTPGAPTRAVPPPRDLRRDARSGKGKRDRRWKR